MQSSSSSSSDRHVCELCQQNTHRYVCPKCNIAYCSSECYKSASHSECSEAFYKQCVEDELHMQQSDPSLRQKTLDILQRIYNDDLDDDMLSEILSGEDGVDYDADLDSDDENLPSLEKRLQNVNLDDADELWSCLTDSEKQEFRALIQSGEATKVLPDWNPWWTYTVKKKLVQDLSEVDQSQNHKSCCPKILEIPKLDTAFKTSPYMRFGIINVIYAYAHCVLFFHGDHHSSPESAMRIFLNLCETLLANKIFRTVDEALQSVIIHIADCGMFSKDQESILRTKEAGDAILKGPDEENRSYYVLAALSDLHQLINEAKEKMHAPKVSTSNNAFLSTFDCKINTRPIEMNKKSLSLISKKIEFYIAWMKTQNEVSDDVNSAEVR
ncbi:hypothetical protein QAD02_022599 [Eretmocerus hayati]|uniref:Uncharacterized protein n=1 Tax=Eretmocerus hayati TaxID=131215 RepID=A0ACC2PYD0_9HYME|nr:hypothetical protein QAD02_022599 [Eretmocerus hayati]